MVLSLEAASADTVWRQLAERVRADGSLQTGRDQPTRELLHVAFTITDPRQRLVLARPMNPAFAIAEVIWILAGANDVAFLRYWNLRMVRYVDEDRRVLHGAYGYRLGSRPRLKDEVENLLCHKVQYGTDRIDQLRAGAEALQHDADSRQVVLQIWDSALDLPSPAPRSRDVPCNVASHLLVRDGRLEWLQVMRSNDLVWGLPYNLVQWTTIQEVVAGWLGIEVGTYNHISDSLHVYERHWDNLDRIEKGSVTVPTNRADLRVGPYETWEKLWGRVVDAALSLTQLDTIDQLLAVYELHNDLPAAYVEWLVVLTAEALRRHGHAAAADALIPEAGPYWELSWRQWERFARDKVDRRATVARVPPTTAEDDDHTNVEHL